MARPGHQPVPVRLVPDIDLGECQELTISCLSKGRRITATYTGPDLVAGIYAEQTVDPSYEGESMLGDAVLTSLERRFHAVLAVQHADKIEIRDELVVE